MESNNQKNGKINLSRKCLIFRIVVHQNWKWALEDLSMKADEEETAIYIKVFSIKCMVAMFLIHHVSVRRPVV